jgi:lipoprotein
LRHHQDPFITASAITAGCSSSTNVTTSCFGRSRHDDLMMMSLFLTAGLAGVITDITVETNSS